MPDSLTEDGLQIKTLPEIQQEMIAALKETYGDDINVDPNSPDGQLVNIFAQAAIDSRELLKKVYDSFDVHQAQGRVLDQRVALGGIKRKAASFSFASVEVTVDREVQLQGLDGSKGEISPSIPNLFTVKDASGTEYYLLSSVTLPSPPVVAPPTPSDPDAVVDPDALTLLQEWERTKELVQTKYNEEYARYLEAVSQVTSVEDWDTTDLPIAPVLPPILYLPSPDPAADEDPDAEGDSVPEREPSAPTKTHSLYFRAAPIGKKETLANTITESVTIIAGVESVNNRSKAPIQGEDEETDAILKRRFARSSSISAQGYLEGIQSQIEALPQVDTVRVYENDTSEYHTFASDGSGDEQSPHSIWVIVRGSREDSGISTPQTGEGTETQGDTINSLVRSLKEETKESIAQILYEFKPAGTGMYVVPSPTEKVGTEKILRPNSQYFVARWNEAIERSLYLQMDIRLRADRGEETTLSEQNIVKLKESFVGVAGGERLQWELGQNAGIDDVYSFLSRKHPKYRITKVLFSKEKDADPYTLSLVPAKKNEIFTLSQEGITINGI